MEGRKIEQVRYNQEFRLTPDENDKDFWGIDPTSNNPRYGKTVVDCQNRNGERTTLKWGTIVYPTTK